MNKVLDFVQFRTFTHTYFFKVTDNKVVLKVYDLGQKSVKASMEKREDNPSLFADLPKTIRDIRERPAGFFESARAVHPNFEIPTLEAPEPDLGTCQDYLRQAIEELKSKTIIENEASKQFTCPITHEVFKDPVVLSCGHTFEKEALEQATQEDKRCPLDRQLITSTAPNFGVKSALEKWKKEDPIPNFSSFQRKNPSLAQANLAAAQASLEEEEYDQALTSYKTAFQYTKDSKEYAAIPKLYKLLKNPEKERLAWLYYALYALEEGDLLAGISHLEQAKALESQTTPSLFINFALIMLYSLARQQLDPRKVKQLIQETVPLLETTSSQAVFYTQQILLQDCTTFPLYEQLAKLLHNQEEIKQLFLKGALHALRAEDLTVTRAFYEKSSHITENSKTPFEDLMLASHAYPQDQRIREILQKAHQLSDSRAFKPARQTLKMLLHYQENPTYYQSLVDTYFKEDKTDTLFPKTTRLLDLYLKQRSYDLAQQLTDQVVSKIELSNEQKIEWYKKLETVYAEDPSKELLHHLGLKDIWEILGKAYESLQNFPEAQTIYEKAHHHFNDLPLFSFKLASVLCVQGKIKESVLTYYAEAERAISKQDLTQLKPCYQEIIKIDPQMKHLEGIQKIHLVSQMQILSFQTQIATLTHELKEQKIQIARLGEQLTITNARLAAVINPPPPLAFGALKWEQYFGDVGIEPPLPADIQTILSSPCPIFPGKTVQESHMLVLIPKTVNGRPFTLNALGELVQHPKQGNATKYQSYWEEAKKAHGETSPSHSHWVLMTKDVLPGSRDKSYADQCKLVDTYRQKTKLPYEVPHFLEAATSIFLEHVQSGMHLYSQNPSTYTRCQEAAAGCQVVVGGFAPAGLSVGNYDDDHEYVGVGVVRQFL